LEAPGKRSADAPHAPPRNGERPIVPMQIFWKDTDEITVLALLDTGATCPLIASNFVDQHRTPHEIREAPLPISTFDGATLPGAGLRYTHRLRLRHGEHVTREAFEIGPLEPSSDIILPHWWMVKHPPVGLIEAPDEGSSSISFTSPGCRTRCTQYALDAFPIRYDDDILSASTDESGASVGCLGYLKVGSEGTAVIDWNLLHVAVSASSGRQ